MKKNIFIIIAMIAIIIIGLVLSYYFWQNRVAEQGEEKAETEEIVIEENDNTDNGGDKSDLIELYSPKAGQIISSPLMIYGQARGTWFFEGDFPVVLTDWDGLIIAQGYATAQDDWMTEEFVPFTAELEFTTPELYNNGALILQKDNPSGLPENDDALEIAVLFKTDDVTTLEEKLKKMLATEHDWDIDLTSVNISQMSEHHARGGVMFYAKETGEEGEGGYLYASNIKGEWEVIAQGNGQISCELLSEYEFPEDMEDQCS